MNKLYLIGIGIVFAAFTILFDFFPRPAFSELEKRELATFPTLTTRSLASGQFTADVSSWFSDSEPYRDRLMGLSMEFKRWIAVSTGESNITFHAADAPAPVVEDEPVDSLSLANRDIKEYTNKLTADEKAKIAHNGILILGSGDNVRALMAYGGGAEGGGAYANAVNRYSRELGDQVTVYCMVIPTAIEFYCPEEARKKSRSQRATINNIFAHLDSAVVAVDVYTILGENAHRDIYLRTDHHWAPLGAHLAAQKFAAVAGVPFRDLSAYDRQVVHGFVGTMYGYSRDIAVKNAPEDFVYYVPNDVDYTTTYIYYSIDKQLNITGESGPVRGEYFKKFKDGSGGAYSTFMGGDAMIVKVQTSTPGKRRVLVIKDSFGNAVPSNLFYSFEQVHVIDYRYFNKNVKKYIADNGITDVLFANNTFVAYNPSTATALISFLK